MNLHFSKHAFDRVHERLGLSSVQIKELFEKSKTVPLGIETGSNRSHDLFFSVLDNACFVGVRDTEDGTIVTIVPAEWHNKWKISIEAMTEAKQLANNKKPKKRVARPVIDEAPSKLKVKGHVNYRIVNLGTLEIEKYKTAEAASKNPEAIEAIIAKANEKKINIDSIDMISINNGGKTGFVRYMFASYKDEYVLYQS